MTRRKLTEVDLNLLAVLGRLLEFQSVTKTALELGVSQPAITHHLKQLRALFSDPLLVRTRYGMTPTALALEMEQPLRKILEQVRVLLDPRNFDPSTANLTYRIEMDDYTQLLLLPKLHAKLGALAPGIRVWVQQPSPMPPAGLLEVHDLQMAIGGERHFVGEFKRQRILTDRLVCLVRAGHPMVDQQQQVSLQDFLRTPHISVSPSPMVSKLVDDAVAAIDAQRYVAAWVPSIVPAAMLACQTDFVLVIQKRAADLVAPLFGGVVVPCPLALQNYTSYQVWHGTTDTEPSGKWMRSLIAEAASTLEKDSLR
jgi:LysR family transcriptional regulator, mexEF-oprN operon transcriptional activator